MHSSKRPVKMNHVEKAQVLFAFDLDMRVRVEMGIVLSVPNQTEVSGRATQILRCTFTKLLIIET